MKSQRPPRNVPSSLTSCHTAFRLWAILAVAVVAIASLNSALPVVAQTDATPSSTDATVVDAPEEIPSEAIQRQAPLDPQERLKQWMKDWNPLLLILVIVISIAVLSWGADLLVEEAVELSLRSGVPRVVVGATAVSLGTTAPEAVVSVLAAVQGEPDLALGNAVGSIICDTGLILGLACLIAPLPINRTLVNRQGWVQFGSGVLLVAACFPWTNPASAFTVGSSLPQYAGWFFLLLLGLYMLWSVHLARTAADDDNDEGPLGTDSVPVILIKLIFAIALVLVSSSFLIAAVTELAEQLRIPKSIIAATLVAFGTSLPELVIAITAVLKRRGELAIGNVIGADILNVLFVAGAAASVTPGGLTTVPSFFSIQFPAMLFVLLVFRMGIWRASRQETPILTRPFGVVLLTTYLAVTIASYLLSGSSVGH